MGLFDFFRRQPQKEPAPVPVSAPAAYVTGSVEPSTDEAWPLTLRRLGNGAVRLEYVSLGAVQHIHGIHEQLVPQLALVPDGTELAYLCRVAEGLHYNVRHLIAVALAEGQPEAAVAFLPEAFVSAQPELRLARAAQRIAQRQYEAAIDDLRVGIELDLERARSVFETLPSSHRAPVLELFAAWVARRPLNEERAALLPLEHWSTDHLREAASTAHRTEAPWNGHDLEALVAELERRGSSHAEVFKTLLADRAALQKLLSPALLKPELLVGVLERRDEAELGVYADTLCETHHPFGEFLALHRKGDRKSLKQAKDLALSFERSWLGPIEAFVEADYERGLPITARVVCASPSGFDWKAALAHPMLRAFRRLEMKRTKKTRRTSADPADCATLARALLPFALTALDCGDEVLDSLDDADLTRLTELLELDLTDRARLEPRRFPRVERVSVSIRAGQTGATLEWLEADPTRFFATRRPHLDLLFHGGASQPELARLRSVRNALSVQSLTVAGEPLS